MTTRLSKNLRTINSGGIHVKGRGIPKAGMEVDASHAVLNSQDSNAMLLKDFLSQETEKGARAGIPEMFKQITQSGSTHFEALKVK